MERIKKIEKGSKEYPDLLLGLKNPPAALYVRGRIPDSDLFAMVGTRRYSAYGKRAALDIAQQLTEAGLGIVSGMAAGIDTFSHQGCLMSEGQTVAVLGSGVDEESLYPKKNLSLARKIVKKRGAVISEYPAGTEARKYQFPQRNRIISGLARGVLVIEAKKKSGALITARWAREQSKKLFALPGSIYSLNSAGPNNLIKQGAVPVTSARDIIDKMGLAKKPVQKKMSLPGEEALIAEALQAGGLHIEEIIKKTGLKPGRAAGLLSQMEIEGKVKNLKGNTYSLPADIGPIS